jgi:flagellar basal body-associated protein FliL
MDLNLEETKIKAKSIMKKSLWILLISAIFFSIGYYIYRTWTISEGTRTGILYKISKKGAVIKTYEGQLHLAGSNIMSKESIWEFSVKDEETYKLIQQIEGKNAKLHYKQLQDGFFWQGDTDYMVYKAELIQ